ncbi:hypothetical protein QMK19_26410 [Streptomyces sp. H10-C2]|uniref:hypothetical protein n=1 Tax=unclassified Streptomyces TaxID=2593676 RepID=UPI0024BB9282|nr:MULTISPECIES: hypothetical protein [unclassified Streptomyces]MDJ0344144.1 hypothetical protein [Streptomyces sp. PH10-H1]MDJ0373097.1 hypothetical protein [Streptomyces sp. H10-C2]
MKVNRLRARLLASAGAFVLLSMGAGQVLTAVPAAADSGARVVGYAVDDLGTLGGTASSAAAIDNATVVGTSQITGDATTHAFAYDRHTRTMTDLGTLGTFSRAIAVEGPFVVGVSGLSDGGPVHGFAYDLPKHTMTDIGTLGGSSISITGLSGHTIVGSSSLAGDLVTHAFAYNLVTHTMTDLGSLAGPSGTSSAADVSGHFVVGTSSLPGGPATSRHGFVYNLLTHTMTDLGTLGGTISTATAISWPVVVGQSRTAGDASLDGYAYNLLTHTRTDLGRSLMISQLVSGKTAVGADSLLAFTFDLTTHAITRIGPGNGVTEVKAIKGDLIVGDVFAPNSFAFAYDVKTATFTKPASLGGLNSVALQSGCHGIVVGSAALPPPDPRTANGPYHAVIWVPHAV